MLEKSGIFDHSFFTGSNTRPTGTTGNQQDHSFFIGSNTRPMGTPGNQQDHSFFTGSNTRPTGTPGNQQDIALQTLGNRGSLISTTSSLGKPSALAAFAGLIAENNSQKETFNQKVRVCLLTCSLQRSVII
jgi:hypothetical protein